jgi:hypothetical protein
LLVARGAPTAPIMRASMLRNDRLLDVERRFGEHADLGGRFDQRRGLLRADDGEARGRVSARRRRRT